MSSSGDKPMNTRDFRHVYVRRRRRNATGSGRVVRDLDLNFPPPSEPSMPKTDGSFEILDDCHVSPASNLFEREAIIPRRKRSTTNCKPPHYPPPPPSADHHESSSAAVPLSPAPILFKVSTVIPSRKRSTINRKPRRYPGRAVQPSLQLAPGKEWCCPTCCRIDDDELSIPIKYLMLSK